MSRAIHFDLSADNPERAARFYSGVFGWKIEKWQGPSDYWLINTGDDYAEKVQSSGGEIREEKRAIPGVGYLVMCRDTEGNTFGIMQIDESVRQGARIAALTCHRQRR